MSARSKPQTVVPVWTAAGMAQFQYVLSQHVPETVRSANHAKLLIYWGCWEKLCILWVWERLQGLQIQVNVSRLIGSLPQFRDQKLQPGDGEVVPVDVLVEAVLAVEGHVIDGPVRSALVPAGPHGCGWNAADQQNAIPFTFKVCAPQFLCQHEAWFVRVMLDKLGMRETQLW
jgi:hypothetical protein